MSMMRYTYDYNGMRYTIDAPAGATPADLAGIVEGGMQPPPPMPAPVAAPQPQPAKKQEFGFLDYLADVGRGVVHSLGDTISGFGSEIVSEAPKVLREGLAQTAGMLAEGAPGLGALIPKGIAGQALAAATREVPGVAEGERKWAEGVAPAAEAIQRAGENVSGLVGPRVTPTWQESEGFWGGLGSLAVSASESSIPTVAALATGLLTKNPRAAMTVMGLTSVPQTYSGIRQQQKQEGIEDVGQAVIGTIASSALDILTGAGGAVANVGRQALKDALESGLLNAAKRVARTGREEFGTEMLQNMIEQVAGGADPYTKQSLMDTLEAGLVGLVSGTTFGGAAEGATALQNRKLSKLVSDAPVLHTVDIQNPSKPGDVQSVDILSIPTEDGMVIARTGAGRVFSANLDALAQARVPTDASEPPIADTLQQAAAQREQQGDVSTALRDAYLGIFQQEVGREMQANPGLTQPQAVKRVGERAAELLDAAQQQVAAAPAVDTGVDVSGGLGESVPPVEGAVPPGAVPGERAPTAARGLGEPTTSVPVTTPSEAAGEPALAAEFDPVTLPVYEAPNMAARKAAAKPIINNIIDTTYGDITVPAKVTNTIATQMAQRAARKEVFNPTEIVQSVLTEAGIAPAPVAAPEQAETKPVEIPGAQESIARHEAMGRQVVYMTPEEYHAAAGRPSPEAARPGITDKLAQDITANGLQEIPWIDPSGREGQEGRHRVDALAKLGYTQIPVAIVAAPETPSTITPAPTYTPQQIIENIGTFAQTEAEDRGLDPAMFREGVRDIAQGREPLADQQILDAQGPEYLDAYKSGMQWAQERFADLQAQPAVEKAPQEVLDKLGKEWEEAEDFYNSTYRNEELSPEGMSDKETEMFLRGHDKAWNDSQRAAANYFRASGNTKELKFYLGQISNRTDAEQVELNQLVTTAANDDFGGPVDFDPNNPEDADKFARMLQPSRPSDVQAKNATDFNRGVEGLPQPAPEQTFEDIGKPNSELISGPSSNDIAFRAEELPEVARVNVRARLDRIMAQHAKDGDTERLVGSLEALRQDVDTRIDRERIKRGRDRVRGFERAMEVIYRAERNEQLNPEGAQIVRWLLEQNPAIADELAISIREGVGQKAAGQYNPAARLATIFANNANDGTAAHEVLHHAERLMPEKVRAGVRTAWMKRIQDLTKIADQTNNADMREVLGAIVAAYYGDTKAQQALKESFEAGTIPASAYHLSNPSEFWAVNAADLVGKRAKQTGWLNDARNWIRGLIEKAKDVFGLPNDSAVITGLKAILAVEDGTISGNMLSDKTDLFRAAPSSGPSDEEVIAATKLTKAQTNFALQAAGLKRQKADNFQRKIVQSRNATEMGATMSKLTNEARSQKSGIDTLKALTDAFTDKSLVGLLTALSTDDITRWVGNRIKAIPRINKVIEDITVYRLDRIRKLSEDSDAWTKFNAEFEEGGRALGDVMHAATFYDVDPSLAPSAAEYMKRDAELQELIRKGARPEQISRRKNEIKRVYEGGATEDGEVIYGWNDLASAELGAGKAKAIYRMARDAYRKTFNDHYDLLMKRIDDAGMEEDDAERAKDFIEKLFRDARNKVVYFPLMRHGRYWLSVGKGKNSEFYLFESATARNKFRRTRQKELDAEGLDLDMEEGDNIRELRANISNKDASVALKNIFETLEGGSVMDMDVLKDHIFQMYLQALPESDMRKRFTRRQYKTGFSTDTLRNFIVSQHTAANQLARLAHAPLLRNTISAGYAELKGNPKAPRLRKFLDEVAIRAKAEIEPEMPLEFAGIDFDKVLNAGNKLAFIWLLTSPKSALIQMIQLHAVGLPVLSAEFGEKDTYATAARYGTNMILGRQLSTTKRNKAGDIITEWGEPSIRDSKYITSLKDTDPDLHKAMVYGWNYANDRDMFMSTYAADMTARGEVPSGEYGAINAMKRGQYGSAAWQGTKAAISFMSGGFHHMERINRETMYMSTFELAYKRAIKQGQKPKAAQKIAAELAAKLTYEAMFNFSNYNKPRVTKARPFKLATNFMTYSASMTSYLVRNFYGMLPFLNKEGKVAATRKFFGTLAMTFMYGGMTALPLYSFFMALLDGLRSALGGDEEDEFLRYADESGNPVGKLSTDYWFRTKFIPETFGTGSTLAKALGISDEAAEVLARSADKGPVSAITGLDIGSSSSLDNLWFNSDITSEGETAMYEYVGRTVLGPTGAVLGKVGKALKLYEDGFGDRAFETLLPAFFAGGAKASRFADEGVMTKDGKEIKPADFFNFGRLFGQTLGFANTEVSQLQKENVMVSDIEKTVSDRKSSLISRFNTALGKDARHSTASTRATLDDLGEEIDRFNDNFPYTQITPSMLGSATQRSTKEAAQSVEGANYNPRIPAASNLMENR